MALYHRATLTPTKEELLRSWVPTRSWAPAEGANVEVIGAYRLDDPGGRVGIEHHLVSIDGTILHVPLTYRDEPMSGADDALVTEMHHSVLGPRWVYDGLRDPVAVTMLAAAAMTGQGEALGMVSYDDRWHIAPTKVRIRGGGWTLERAAVDGFETVAEHADRTVLRNDRFELTVFRRPPVRERPAMGLTARWDDHPEVLLAAVTELG